MVEFEDPELEKSELNVGIFPKSWFEGVPHDPFTSPKLPKPLSVLNELFWWTLLVLFVLFVLLTTPVFIDVDGIVVVVIVVVVVTVVVVVLLFPVDIVSIFVVLTVDVVFGIEVGTTVIGVCVWGVGDVGAVPGAHTPIAGSK